MREITAIISAWDEACKQGLRCVLATVVHVSGSAYRGAGARMLVDAHGRMTGAISGGCLEGDALRKALHALDQGRNKLVTYDTTDEEDAVIGAQLGCNGVIQVLFEPLDTSDADNPIELLRRANEGGSPQALICLFDLQKSPSQPGTRRLIDGQGLLSGKIEDADLTAQIQSESAQAIQNRQSQFVVFQAAGKEIHAFIEVMLPPPALVLVGAGNDAQVLAQMAEVLGWDITIVDGRPTHAKAERFGSACQVIVSKPEHVLEALPEARETAFVLMTHNYNYDLAVLKLLLTRPHTYYIGILGPKKKYQRMIDDLAEEGIVLSANQIEKIYAPVGLELGADTPAEIGLSILAEIQAVLTRSSATHLRDRHAPIHDQRKSAFKTISL